MLLNMIEGTIKLIALTAALLISHHSFAQSACLPDTTNDTGFVAFGDASIINVTTADGGALEIVGRSQTIGLGAAYRFDCLAPQGINLAISTHVHNQQKSYTSFRLALHNVTDDVELATTGSNFLSASSSASQFTLNYTTKSSDANDQLELRYIRTDDGHRARRFAIDNASINGNPLKMQEESDIVADNPTPKVDPDPTCSAPITFNYDIPLQSVTARQKAEVDKVYDALADTYIRAGRTNLSASIKNYDALNIVVSNGTITGNNTSYRNAGLILKAFARHLIYTDPSDQDIATRASNLAWLISKKVCSGEMARENNTYGYREYARAVVHLKDYLSEDIKNKFGHTLKMHSENFQNFWDDYQDGRGYNTDWIYNISDSLILYGLLSDTATDAERVRWLKGAQRYLERFLTDSHGASDGIKPDGTGFHHGAAYDGYMYAFVTLVNIVSALDDTSFQISVDAYKRLRDFIYMQRMMTNDRGIRALSMAGRNPGQKTRTTGAGTLEKLAVSGGKILGLSTADPLLAGYHNRVRGDSTRFNYGTKAEFEEGFFQLNYANAGVFRKRSNTGKGDWLAVFKGFNRSLFGSEIYVSTNRYGRYQSYGAMEIIYPGDNALGNNGFDVNNWNWNYNPGTTSILLPWSSLHGERSRIDEVQHKWFAGSLALENKGVANGVLRNTYGRFGLFAMDFQQMNFGGGWGVNYGPNSHNETFTFKKSNFAFSDIIVALGSDISNDDVSHPTITTLYQRMGDAQSSVMVDYTNYDSASTEQFPGNSDHWVIDDYGTGFYVTAGSGDLTIWKGTQQTPNQNQIWPADITQNATGEYTIGHLSHGTAPGNAGYEYVVVPNASSSVMQNLRNQKPYVVHEKSSARHVVNHRGDKIWGYALFEAAAYMDYPGSVLEESSGPGLVMYREVSDTDIVLSVTDPNLGFGFKKADNPDPKQLQLTLRGDWSISQGHRHATLISANDTYSVLEFTIDDGLPVEVRLVNLNPPETVPQPEPEPAPPKEEPAPPTPETAPEDPGNDNPDKEEEGGNEGDEQEPLPAPTPDPGARPDFKENFDTTTGGFRFIADPQTPRYSLGGRVSSLGYNRSGALQVLIGGRDNRDILDITGHWSRTFSGSGKVNLSVKARLLMTSGYERDEYIEARVRIDDQSFHIHRVTGDGDGGGIRGTGFMNFTQELNLGSGQHTVTLECFNNKKTFYNERSLCIFDDLSIK